MNAHFLDQRLNSRQEFPEVITAGGQLDVYDGLLSVLFCFVSEHQRVRRRIVTFISQPDLLISAFCGMHAIQMAQIQKSRSQTQMWMPMSSHQRSLVRALSIASWHQRKTQMHPPPKFDNNHMLFGAFNLYLQPSQESARSVHFRHAPDSIIPRSEVTASESARSSPLLGIEETEPAPEAGQYSLVVAPRILDTAFRRCTRSHVATNRK